MLRLLHLILISPLLIALMLSPAAAFDGKDIGSVTVLTEPKLAVPLSELASKFARTSMITVSASFGASENQEKHIEEGEAADLFITSSPQLIDQLRMKGMVDVHSIGRVAAHHDIRYFAAVVASENMTSARAFLAFIKSDAARAIWKKNGLSPL